MKAFIEYLVKNLVDLPENVSVSCQQNESRVFIEVRVAPSDVGKVIGRRGVIINSLRIIAETVSARYGCKVNLELVEHTP